MTLLRRTRLLRGAWPLLIVLTVAAAGNCADFLNALARRESSMDPQAHNPYGYVGLFQMGEAALIDAGYYRSDGTGRNDWVGAWTGVNGVSSLEDFKNNPQAQAAAITAYHARVWSYIQAQGLERYLGQTVGGVEMTRSGMIAAAHLVGTGNLGTFLRSNGTIVPRDGNRTPITEYASRFGGYELTGSAANCAEFARGVPTGGVPIGSGTGATTPGTHRPPTGVAAGDVPGDNVDSAEAYYRSTGYSMDEAGRTVRAVLSAVLMLAAAWSVIGNWSFFAEGHGSLQRLLHNGQRIVVVLLAMFVLLT